MDILYESQLNIRHDYFMLYMAETNNDSNNNVTKVAKKNSCCKFFYVNNISVYECVRLVTEKCKYIRVHEYVQIY